MKNECYSKNRGCDKAHPILKLKNSKLIDVRKFQNIFNKCQNVRNLVTFALRAPLLLSGVAPPAPAAVAWLLLVQS